MRTSDWSSDVCSSDLLVGDRPTLADALFIGVARWLDFHEVAEPVRWPKLAALRARLEADPAVAYTTALESGENAAIGRAHVCTPVTNAHLVCPLLLEKKKRNK